MPSNVYSSIFQNFIRQGFTKSFTYGYAQSVVAATHPHVLNSQNRTSFARRNSNRVARLSSLGLQNAFHTTSAQAAGPTELRGEKANNHGGLDAYFEDLQKSHDADEVEQEWVQFQFPKRIEWKPSPASILVGSSYQDTEDGQVATGHASVLSPEEQAALGHVDAALKQEIVARKELETVDEEKTFSPQVPTPEPAQAAFSRATPVSPSRTPDNIGPTATPPFDPQSSAYAQHLLKLSADGRYAEIPAVFEAMLVGGVKPIPAAYNALLMAAIHLPSERIEIVSKALDVYSDMLRRKVSPDSDTYNILVGLLAARSLEVASLKKVMDQKRLRFGGMDEPGKFMFASQELEHAILCEDDRLDLAIKLFESSVLSNKATYSPETYHQLISACAQSGRVSDMLQLFEHMEAHHVTPFAATFPAMITAFAGSGDLASAVECYNEYKNLASANDNGEPTLHERLDARVYASVIHAYIISDKIEGALKFFQKINQEYGVRVAGIKDAIIRGGFIQGLLERGIYHDALEWARSLEDGTKDAALGEVVIAAADHGDTQTAVTAFTNLSASGDVASSTMALLAMSVRGGDVAAASRYWKILCSPELQPNWSFVEPTAMYAVAMVGTGHVAEALTQAEGMFQRIRDVGSEGRPSLAEEIEEASDLIGRFMTARNITDPRVIESPVSYAAQTTLTASQYTSTPTVAVSHEDTFDPYAHNTDFKGSSLISDELNGSPGRKAPKLNDVLTRLRNMRRAGRHPRYITYAKLISAAAREGRMELCDDILSMARSDVPLLPRYAMVRYGWSSILDAMVGASLTAGRRDMAEQYHQELLAMGATPSANTFGLYITTLKESTRTFDEATEAVKIFHRAKAEGVEPSSFLYNALIGKLGKARRIDDCLLYFADMRALGIKPTSVTYGTIVNALCRVSDEKFAEELFEEMESMPNYKARPAPYNSMMQFFLTTKRDKTKVLAYYDRMQARGIAPTTHTYKLLVDTHATLEPIDMTAAEGVLDMIRASKQRPEPVHYASLIHARGCVLHDVKGARRIFDSVASDPSIQPNPCLYQALFEAMVANHHVADTEPLLIDMRKKRVELTPYIANTVIHGWAAEKNIDKAKMVYAAVGPTRREPSTYEAMTRAYLAVEDRQGAKSVISEMLLRGYPSAVSNKVLELLAGGQMEHSATSVMEA